MIEQAKFDAGLEKSSSPKGMFNGKSKTSRIMDFRPSQGLTSGLKRIGGRGKAVSRLGNFARKGKVMIEHKY